MIVDVLKWRVNGRVLSVRNASRVYAMGKLVQGCSQAEIEVVERLVVEERMRLMGGGV